MYTENNYHIEKNRNGRKILVVTGVFHVQEQDILKYDDFDAIFIDVSEPIYEVIRHIFWKVCPIFQSKCWLKPIFFSRILEEKVRLTKYLVDGFASTPIENSMAERIEEIYAQIAKFGFEKKADALVKSTHDMYIRLCQYALSRGVYTFTSGVIPGVEGGYTRLYTALFESERKLYTEDRALFNKILLEKDFVRVKRFVEKVHLCPKCNHSHLLFMETCPNCKSSDIKSESVIHHFRCANISPESTYSFGDELRCPKCKKMLRHIGVDYDRPSDVYLCNNCGRSFFTPKMKVICMGCGEHTTPSELKTFDSIEYEFTESGIQALVANSILLSVNNNIQLGYVEFDNFIGSILSIAHNQEEMERRVILVTRIFIDDEKSESIDQLNFYKEGMHRMLSVFRYSQISYNKKFFYQMYLSEIEYKDSIWEIIHSRHKMVMNHLYENYGRAFNFKIEEYSYQKGDSLSDFVKEIQKQPELYSDKWF